MMTVTVSINGHPIITRSCRNISEDVAKADKYIVDDGRLVIHNRDDGAAVLAIELLKGVTNINGNS